jgi:DNA-binding LacI/PurR family transcriptional regulator
MSKAEAQQLLQELRGRIEGRFLLPGTALPSENKLCMDYGVSRPTVRRILEKLSQLQLVEKRPGIGTFVKDPREKKPLSLFRLGVDFGSFYNDHYYQSIWSGLNNSPFGKNCYFHLLDKEKLQHGLLDNEVDGLMLGGFDGNPSVLERLQNTGKPLIVINRSIQTPANIAYVSVDHRQETAAAVEYLFRYGHRKIAFVGGNLSSGAVRARQQGWMDAFCREGQVPTENLQISLSDLLQPDFSRKLQDLLAGQEFTAAVCGNSFIYQRFCLEYYRVASPQQKEPEVIVFDDVSHLTETSLLPCSYIQMPLERFGAIAAEFLRKKKDNPSFPPVQQILPCSLVIRQKRRLPPPVSGKIHSSKPDS